MARAVKLNEFQAMQRGEGEEELEDAAVAVSDGGRAIDDLLHGDGDYPTESDIPCDECGGVVILRSAEEDRRLASRVADGVAIDVLCDDCAAAESPVEPKAEDRADVGGARVYDVEPDGAVRDWRRPETTPDRGDVTEVHTITDDEPRFSGAGAKSDGYVGAVEDNVSKLIPTDGAFLNERHKAAPELANVAEKLIDEHGFLERLRHCRIDYKWRRKGTNSKGKRAIGKLERVSGIWSAYVPYTFVVWLAADTARLASFTDRQVEAALFHQLAHIDQDAKGNWIKVGHDFEGFGTEVRHYGPWTEDLKIGSQSFVAAHQMGLFDESDDDQDDDEGEEGEEIDAARMAQADGALPYVEEASV